MPFPWEAQGVVFYSVYDVIGKSKRFFPKSRDITRFRKLAV
jgi:hypothetical protein